jgi:hypothetical protein
MPTSLAVAAVAHAVLLALAVTSQSRVKDGAREAAHVSEIEVEAEPMSTAPIEPPLPDAPPRDEAPAAQRVASPGSVAPHTRTTKVDSATPGSGEAAPATSGTGWSFSPTTAPSPAASARDRDERLTTAVRAGVKTTVDEEAKRTAKLPIFTPRDIELGLVPGGAYVALTREKVQASRTPVEGHAVLELRTDAAGHLVEVRVLETSSGRDAWNEVAASLVAAHPPPFQRIPARARGVAITVDITTVLRTVDGVPPPKGTVSKVLRAVNDPLGAIADGHTPAIRVIAVRVVNVQAF